MPRKLASGVLTVALLLPAARSRRRPAVARRYMKHVAQRSRRLDIVTRRSAAAAKEQAPDGCEVVELMATDMCTTDTGAPPLKPKVGKPPSQLDLFFRGLEFYARMVQILVGYIPVKVESTIGEARGRFDADILQRQWDRQHIAGAKDLAAMINDLKGFHVKAGQTIATRTDLFPKEYSVELAHLVDSVNPLPYETVKHVVEEKLLDGKPLSDVFSSFEEEPLGSASIAQVHKATLRSTRKEVAVKVQRPNAEVQLMKDVRDIKEFSRLTKSIFPVDYYTVFSEIESQMQREFDFNAEAEGMDRINTALRRSRRRPPVHVPRSVPGFVSRDVLCMDFVPGVPLSGLKQELKRRGIELKPGSREERLFGRRLLKALSEAFAIMIFEEGFFHADPHPGNVFVMPDLKVALIDFGQTKQLGSKFRKELAEIIVLLSECGDTQEDFERMAKLAPPMGTVYLPTAHPLCSVALGLWLFDTSRTTLPGGYEPNELSPRCPARDCSSFDPNFVLVCRATLLIRGLAARLGVKWSLAKAWREQALLLLKREGKAPPTRQGIFRPVVRSVNKLLAHPFFQA